MIVGGTEAERKNLLDLHEQYLVANGKFDWPGIEPIWSEAPFGLISRVSSSVS